MSPQTNEIFAGMDVYDVKNEKIGTVEEILDAPSSKRSPSGGGYMRVATGFMGLGRVHYIPFGTVRSIVGDRIEVNFAKDQLDELGYDHEPLEMDRDTAFASDEPDGRRLELREEELVVQKHPVETGRVRLNKEVVAEERTIDVPVTREEVYVERRPINRQPSDQPIDDDDRTIEVRVREEQLEVEKRPVVYEEVEVGKRQVTDTRRVTETVRREEAHIDDEATDVEVRKTDPDARRA